MDVNNPKDMKLYNALSKKYAGRFITIVSRHLRELVPGAKENVICRASEQMETREIVKELLSEMVDVQKEESSR